MNKQLSPRTLEEYDKGGEILTIRKYQDEVGTDYWPFETDSREIKKFENQIIKAFFADEIPKNAWYILVRGSQALREKKISEEQVRNARYFIELVNLVEEAEGVLAK